MCALGQPAHSADPDDNLVAAQQAWQARNIHALERYAKKLANYPLLTDYPAFWLLDAQLSQPGTVPNQDVRAFLARFPESPLQEPLRVSWLKALAREGEWDVFSAQVTQAALEDPEVGCDHLQNRLRKRDLFVARDVRALWFENRLLPDACNVLFRTAASDGLLTQEDVWLRLRRSLGISNLALARYTNSFLPEGEAIPDDDLTTAYNRPSQYLDSWNADNASRASRELVLFALSQYAARDALKAAQQWAHLTSSFSLRDQSWGWAQVAYQGTLSFMPQAVTWYRNVAESSMNDHLWRWRTRSALRQKNWEEVLYSIQHMSAGESEQAPWRYWKARALKALGHDAEAEALLKPLSQEANFYGLLALEDLGQQFAPPPAAEKPTQGEVDALRPRFERSLKLRRLGLATESQFEWSVANRPLNNRQHLVAAELARQEGWFDRSIYSVERSGDQQDFDLQFPLAYQQVLHERASQNQLDEAWVFGLVRQESHFFPEARSRSGAIGLMQLMPATARWVARRLPIKGFFADSTSEVDTNVRLGTYYLHLLLKEMRHPVLATAGYNAGPRRVQRWINDKPMESAIFIETIPVNETRGYVRNVMYNATVYAKRLNLPPLSLKERIGTIPGAAPSREAEPDPATQP
jgi:soluble lytic murein transglycosylase